MWNSKPKDLSVAAVSGHNASNPGLVGRAPAVTSIQFTPAALFGAAARCSHLHAVNPALVTPESLLVQALLEPHVDNVSPDFFILATADNLKDYVKSFFAGTVAGGLCYLTMINDGYAWVDHFENLGGGAPTTKRSPDFVFTGSLPGVALVESKGTRSETSGAFNTTVSDGYANQVEPHLGANVGGVTATHGYCVGAFLTSTSSADLRIHHTAVTSIQASPPGPDPSSIAAIQRGNYSTAFVLAHSIGLGRRIRTGEPTPHIPFLRFEWRGRRWVTSYRVGPYSYSPGFFADYFPEIRRNPPYWYMYPDKPLGFSFAMEEYVARAVLKRFLPGTAEEEGELDIKEMRYEMGDGEGDGDGAIFPDGLAVLGREAKATDVRPVLWDAATGAFQA